MTFIIVIYSLIYKICSACTLAGLKRGNEYLKECSAEDQPEVWPGLTDSVHALELGVSVKKDEGQM